MVYRALTEYLLYHGPKPTVRWWLVIVSVGMIFASVFVTTHPMAIVLVSIFAIWSMVALNAWLSGRQRLVASEHGRLGADDWLAELSRFAREKQLESRSHPQLIEELEACALLRQDIVNALQSSEWETLALKPGWREVRKQCETSAESLFEDALWASKGAFRPLGGRRDTFVKRCQDPDFASAALGGVRLIRAQLAKLLDEVHDDPFAGHGVRDALARAQAELKAIRDAEAELRASV